LGSRRHSPKFGSPADAGRSGVGAELQPMAPAHELREDPIPSQRATYR
jgi:hypothetical protein